MRYGTLTRHQLRSDFLHNTREVMIYRPRLPQPARWTLMLFDGKTYQDEYRFANVLDSLIASHVLPPINVVFIDSLDHPRRAKELPPNPFFADFMAHELLPWLRQQGLDAIRQKTVVAGSSYGGLAASWVALRYPRLFANVLSLSGSYWWGAQRRGSRLADAPSISSRRAIRYVSGSRQAGLRPREPMAGSTAIPLPLNRRYAIKAIASASILHQAAMIMPPGARRWWRECVTLPG